LERFFCDQSSLNILLVVFTILHVLDDDGQKTITINFEPLIFGSKKIDKIKNNDLKNDTVFMLLVLWSYKSFTYHYSHFLLAVKSANILVWKQRHSMDEIQRLDKTISISTTISLIPV
jgi:hypothetical protein